MSKGSLIAGIVAVLALMAVLVALVELATVLDWTFGSSTVFGTTRITNLVSVFGAVAMLAILAAQLAILIDDRRHRREISPLYPTIVAQAAMLAIVAGYIAWGALASLRYGPQMPPAWGARFEPEVRLAIILVYLCLFLSGLWFIFVVLRRRGLSLGGLVVLFAGVAGVAALIVALAVLW